jgi:hypothetical protein
MSAVPRVFLSYAREEGEAFATAFRRRLAAEEPEITLWQDRAELEGWSSIVRMCMCNRRIRANGMALNRRPIRARVGPRPSRKADTLWYRRLALNAIARCGKRLS